jgi:hypothetical protein
MRIGELQLSNEKSDEQLIIWDQAEDVLIIQVCSFTNEFLYRMPNFLINSSVKSLVWINNYFFLLSLDWSFGLFINDCFSLLLRSNVVNYFFDHVFHSEYLKLSFEMAVINHFSRCSLSSETLPNDAQFNG